MNIKFLNFKILGIINLKLEMLIFYYLDFYILIVLKLIYIIVNIFKDRKCLLILIIIFEIELLSERFFGSERLFLKIVLVS